MLPPPPRMGTRYWMIWGRSPQRVLIIRGAAAAQLSIQSRSSRFSTRRRLSISINTPGEKRDIASSKAILNEKPPRPIRKFTSIAIGFPRSEEHTSELQSLMRISYAVFCLKQKTFMTYKIQYQLHKNHIKIKKNSNE